MQNTKICKTTTCGPKNFKRRINECENISTTCIKIYKEKSIDDRMYQGAEKDGWLVIKKAGNHYLYISPNNNKYSSLKKAKEDIFFKK